MTTDTAKHSGIRKARGLKLLLVNLQSRVRIISGLVLFFYVLLHFSNHAFGLISLEAQEDVGHLVKSFWRTAIMTIALYGALAIHFVLAIWSVYQRRLRAIPKIEWVQLLLGISIPFLVLTHIMGTRYASAAYSINDTYAYVLISTFVFSPFYGVLNSAGLIAAWVHGCIGVHMWLRHKPVYSQRIRFWCLIFASLLPVLALTGYLSAGRRVIPLASDGDWMAQYYEQLNLEADEVFSWIQEDTGFVRWLLVAVFILLIIARIFRLWLQLRRQNIAVTYVDGPTMRHPKGASLLDMSKLCRVPHASVCGGRGRCSTCRVRILESSAPYDPPDESERRLLNRVDAPDDVRLACQLKPQGDMLVARLLPADYAGTNASKIEPWATGRERIVAVMFADLRDFTRTAESRLPFDVVYLINQFSRTMGQAVEMHDGRIDKFLGDGFMALFGVTADPQTAARNALAAASDMVERLDELNERLNIDLDAPLRIGIGIHIGPVILGDIGYGHARGLTALGDPVNTASRLESATKEHQCVLCVSSETIEIAGFNQIEEKKKKVAIRGKKVKLEIHALDHPNELWVEHGQEEIAR